MLINEKHSAELNANEQVIRARVELYNGSTLEKICNCGELLSEFAIEKTGEGKYFGFGICQKLKATLIDMNNSINIDAVDGIEVSFGVDSDFIYPYPKFYLQEAKRDEVFGVIDIAAYDALFQAASYQVSELVYQPTFTLRQFARACATLLGLPLLIDTKAEAAFDLAFDTRANFNGNESVRSALDAVAEATQTIYYIDGNWNLYFKRLDASASPVVTINKNRYVELTDQGERTLATIAHATELGDNIEVPATIEGDTQFLRDNPFLELRNDAADILTQGANRVKGLKINEFYCDWAGNYLLEIGDKISLIKDDNTTITTYVLDDNITFNGALWQINSWEYGKDDTETVTNPTTLGEAINQTIARVDKTNKEITLLAQNTEKEFTSLQLKTDGIEAEIQTLDGEIAEVKLKADGISADFTNLNGEFISLQAKTDGLSAEIGEVDGKIAKAKLDANNALLEFERQVETEGVSKVTTTTGFAFNENGLTVSKSTSEISTTITEDGMTIARQSVEVLTANNEGVRAEDLHATTYLIIGNNSRIEDYGINRTACFWIGG